MKTYIGRRVENGDTIVQVLTFRPRKRTRPLRHVKCHNTTTMDWDYQGSGPADLALSILVNYFTERPPKEGWLAGVRFDRWAQHSQAWKHHQSFKRYFVAYFDYQKWELADTQIAKWLRERRLNE